MSVVTTEPVVDDVVEVITQDGGRKRVPFGSTVVVDTTVSIDDEAVFHNDELVRI